MKQHIIPKHVRHNIVIQYYTFVMQHNPHLVFIKMTSLSFSNTIPIPAKPNANPPAQYNDICNYSLGRIRQDIYSLYIEFQKMC